MIRSVRSPASFASDVRASPAASVGETTSILRSSNKVIGLASVLRHLILCESFSARSMPPARTSTDALGERRDDRPSDSAGGIQPSQRCEHLVGLMLLVSSEVNERERLQGVEREAAGAVWNNGLRLPLPPVRVPSRLARRFAEATLGCDLRLVEMPLIGVNLVKAKVDRKLRWRGRERLPKQLVRPGVIVAIDRDALLQQRGDFFREVSEIDRVAFCQQVGHVHLTR